ncbi:MAG: DUF1475 domain-containing protein [Deltaproteobacteria bacterium]|nr:DUF1475 domain-containing protein [Deltaproteobacteria bacterium]
MKRGSLVLFFGAIFLAMIWVTVTASLDRSVFEAVKDLWADPWGKATLFDTYFAFLVVYLWVFFRDGSWLSKALWLLAFLSLGNLAIAVYFLRLLQRGEDPFPSRAGESS